MPTNSIILQSASNFTSLMLAMPGLTHYYPLNAVSGAQDLKGFLDGIISGQVAFNFNGATFNGASYITLPDDNDFSVTTTGYLSIIVFLTINNWQALSGQYTNWMGKGVTGAHEWTFRYYPVDSSRPRRLSFYHFNSSGGLGAGSYFQDNIATGTEFMVTGQMDLQYTQIFRDGILRDTDPLSSYNIVPSNTQTPVRIGTRDGNTGYLDGVVRRVAFFNRLLSATELGSLWSNRMLPD